MGFPGKMRRPSAERRRDSVADEIEVKLPVADRRGMLRKLSRLKARPATARMHEMNTLYDTPDGALARNGRLLRIRVERRAGRRGDGAQKPETANRGGLLTYKGPRRGQEDEERYKVREEREVRIADPEMLGRILEEIGLRQWFRYEKYRTGYRLPGLRGLVVELDETPIGDFLELEGDRAAIDQAAARLGYGREEYIALSYGALFRESQGQGAGLETELLPGSGLGDMVFRIRK
jgi:adenylate cyclase, class 2